jgi:hypothetical protein
MGKHRDTVDKVKTFIRQRSWRMCWRQFPFDTIDVSLAPLYQFLVDIYPGKLFPVFFCKKIADYPGTAATKIQYIVKRRPLTANTLNAVSYIVCNLSAYVEKCFLTQVAMDPEAKFSRRDWDTSQVNGVIALYLVDLPHFSFEVLISYICRELPQQWGVLNEVFNHRDKILLLRCE